MFNKLIFIFTITFLLILISSVLSFASVEIKSEKSEGWTRNSVGGQEIKKSEVDVILDNIFNQLMPTYLLFQLGQYLY